MDWQERAASLRRTFTPAAPVRHQEMFAGRNEQLMRATDSFHALGEHVAIFGERGVGKTSLAAVSEMFATVQGFVTARVNCTASDENFSVIIRRIGEAIDRSVRAGAPIARLESHFQKIAGVAPGAVAILTAAAPDAHDFLVAMQILSQAGDVVVFLDEFDRLGDGSIHTELVDLMKTVSDQALPVTFVIVGVARDVDALLEEHESTGRGLNEIQMPRMSMDELREVLDRGLAQAEMTILPEAATFISHLSIGLPHYAHLLGLHSGLSAVGAQRTEVCSEDVVSALSIAVARAQQHIVRLYSDATHSTRANNFKEILLAACLTPGDENGFFAPGDIRDALSVVMGKQMSIPAYASQIKDFSVDRGPVLERTEHRTRPRYRFTEPLLVPYVAMRGVTEGIISDHQLRALLGLAREDDVS